MYHLHTRLLNLELIRQEGIVKNLKFPDLEVAPVEDFPVKKLILSTIQDRFAICQLAPQSPVPGSVYDSDFFSITRTHEELSIICPEANVLRTSSAIVAGWRLKLKVNLISMKSEF